MYDGLQEHLKDALLDEVQLSGLSEYNLFNLSKLGSTDESSEERRYVRGKKFADEEKRANIIIKLGIYVQRI